MGASIITGYTGTRHITPEMDGAVYRGIIGDDSYILAEGDQCEGSMPSVNQFTVKSGVVSMQGRQIYITQETLSIDTCPTGYKRIDLICVRFEHDTVSLIDEASLVVIKGAEVSGGNDPVEPAHNEGVIKDGATVVDFVMYRLDFDGASVEISQPSTVQSSLDQIMDNVIVEQGTEDIWTYRKWSNGIAECWGRITGTANITTTWGQIYFASAFSQSLPTGLFIDVPSIQMLNHSSNSALVMGGSSISKDSFNIHLVRGTSQSNAAYNIGCYCIGKWK